MDWPDLSAWTPVDFGAASSVGTLFVAVAATWIARRQLIQARQLREEEAAPESASGLRPAPLQASLVAVGVPSAGW